MLFHVGALWRLNEAGLLLRIKRISSVSGGSIAAGLLGMNWSQLGFDATGVARAFDGNVVGPIRRLGGKTIDVGSVVGGALLPGSSSDKIIRAYRKYLFGDSTLQDLPDDAAGPRFVINATNVQSGVLWRFSKPYMADYKVGRFLKPRVPLAVAVGASTAFPPFLSPVELEIEPGSFVPDPECPLQKEPFTTDVVLSDGGVYDNLGLETAWKRFQTVLVSNGGGHLAPEAEPKRDWGRHAFRVLEIIDSQVRSLRVRQVIAAYEDKEDEHDGVYWGIRTSIADYGLANALPCPEARTLELADTPTRLKRLEPELQERLINWGYAVCDAAIRAHLTPTPSAPAGFPYPGARI